MADQQVSDDALLKYFNGGYDLGVLTPEERTRLVKLTAPKEPAPAASHTQVSPQPQVQTPPQPRLPAAGRGTNIDLAKSYAAAPALGAIAATMAAPEAGLLTPVLRAAAAYGGGYAGSMLKGSDDPHWDALMQVLNEAAAGPQLAMRGLGHGVMDASVPATTRAAFPKMDVAEAALQRGAMPGWEASRRRLLNLQDLARIERTAAAETVPPMNAVGVVSEYRPLIQGAVQAGEPQRAAALTDIAKQTVQNISKQHPRGMPGPAQVMRKDIKQIQGEAAARGSDAVLPSAAEAEREALSRNLRTSPRMSQALDNVQQLKAINEVMDAAKGDRFATRLLRSSGPIEGAWRAVTRSPKFNSLVSQGLYHGSTVVDPQTVRLLQALMAQRSNQEE